MSGNKTKILRCIAMNLSLSMEDLINRQGLNQITAQSPHAFKQYIYQLKHDGSLDQTGGKYSLTKQGTEYLESTHDLPRTEAIAGTQLETCPECDRTVNLDKHKCPNADPLMDEETDHILVPGPMAQFLSNDEVNEVTKALLLEKGALEQMDEPHDDSADFTAAEAGEMARNIPGLISIPLDTPLTDIYIKLTHIDDEIDCMSALVMVMAHFETKEMTRDSRLRITRWFEDKYNPEMRPPQ